MAENITRETDASVEAFIDGIDNRTRRDDARALLDMMRQATGVEPKMWGPSIIGFGSYHYRYDSGREGDMLRIGFSPRKANLALYLMCKDDVYHDLLARLGRHSTGGSCLYVTRLANVDADVLREMIAHSWQCARAKYGD